MASQELRELQKRIGSTQPKVAKKPKNTGVKGFLSSLIGEAGGTGGALGGAAAGATVGSVVPGIGTAIGGLVGAGLGGFLGGTGGQLAENKIRDDKYDVGKALKSGAVEGVLGAGPLKLGKAAFGASKAIKGAEKASDIVRGAESAVKTPLLSNLPGAKKAGTALSTSASGLKPGKEIGAQENVDELSQRLAGMGIKGTPKQQGSQIKAKMGELGKQVDDVLMKTKQPLSGQEVAARLEQGIKNPIDDLFKDVSMDDESVAKMVNLYANRFSDLTDAKSINDQVKRLQTQAKRAKNTLDKGGTPTSKDQAALAVKTAADEVLSKIPEIKPLKQQMASLFEANPDIITASQKGIGLPMTSGVSVKAPIQASKGLMSRVGANLQGAPQSAVSVGGVLGRNATGNILNPVADEPVEPSTVQDPMQNMDAGEMGSLDQNMMPEEQDTSPFSPDNVEANVQQILQQGGNFKDVKEYLDIVGTMSSLSSTGGEKPLSAEASKIVSNANIGLQALDDFEGQISNDPSIVNKRVVPGRGVAGGLLGRALGTSSADAAANQIVDVIARLRTGAAITNDEAKRFQTFIPTAGDTPESAAQKINYLRNQFNMVAQRSGTASTDLEQSLMGA